MIPSALKRFFKKDLSGLSEAEAALHNPDIQIQAASINGETESTMTARTAGYEDPFYASDAITYQAQDSSSLAQSTPSRYSSQTTDPYSYGSARKGKGRAMDLEEALSVIENEEEHEVLAVVYEGDAEADSIIEEFASSALHQERGSGSQGQDSDDDGGGGDDKTEDGKKYGGYDRASLGRGSTHRGYGTIPHDPVEQEDEGQTTPGAVQADGKQWWTFWKR
ncbi:hypothetical protein QFC19_003879 [Naganishia cerealis]|uniref:Uncharacterized protein n=1 Tax=Naganishia cerealis TaxID=610337 RepID=A0ACC2VZA4_9TREE|nr:hypothetical protein QFC19_003879 [Naganishia cerealis]